MKYYFKNHVIILNYNFFNMHKIILVSVLTLLQINLFAQSNDLIRIIEDDKIGYINNYGKIVIKPNYTVGYDFSEGLASVRENDKYGFIDSEGKYVIEPKYDLAFNFYNGIAKVFLKGTPFFIDKKGKIVISKKYTSLEFVNKDLAIVTSASDKKGVLNLVSNNLVIDTIYSSITNFKNGVAIVTKQEVSQKGNYIIYRPAVIDITGKLLVPFNKFIEINDYNDGIAKVYFKDSESDDEIYGFIDDKGNLLFQENYTGKYFLPDYFNDGIGKISIKKKLSETSYNYYDGYINKTGKIVLNDTINDRLRDFSCGRAFILDSNRDYKIVDTNLNKIGNNTYKNFLGNGFINNYAIVSNDVKFGIIDINGNYIVAPKYDLINEIGVVNGYFYYGIENDEETTLWGVANINGTSIIEPKLKEFDVEGFKNGILKTSIDDKLVYFNEKGEIIWKEIESKELKLKNLDIDFMNRGYFSAYSKPNKNDLGGYGTSRNIPKQITNEKFPNKQLSLIVHVDSKDTIFSNFNAYNVTLSNLTNKEINFSAQDSRLYMKVQAKDEDGIWKDIEYLPNSWCGNSYHTLTLERNNYWSFKTPVYSGGFKTKFRIELMFTDRNKNEKEEKEMIIYSNEYDGSINPGQFWNRLEYYPSGIMDPYNE
jgi:hypothetical protein